MGLQDVHDSLVTFCRHLIDEGIIPNTFDCSDMDYYSLVDSLLVTLKKTYPQTKFKRVYKSVHIANIFEDVKLKESMFKLDEVEQVLSFNNFINRDEAVKFYNKQADRQHKAKMEVNQYLITKTRIESLMYNKNYL